jgi:hypothetical protein
MGSMLMTQGLVHNDVDTRRRPRTWRNVEVIDWKKIKLHEHWTSNDILNDAKDVVTSKVDKVDIDIYAWNKKRKSGSLIICIQYCDILFW